MKSSIGLAKDKNCQAIIYDKKQKKYEDTNSKDESSKCSDKYCQEKENINMWSVTNKDNMQLLKPTVLYEYSRLCSDKNCQSTRCYNKESSETNV